MIICKLRLDKNPSQIVDTVEPKNHAGFVYVKVGEEYGVPIYEMRKPNPFERKCIVANYIRMNSKKMAKVPFLADKLGVTDRTIQLILKQLVEEGMITSTPSNGKDGRQTGNIYVWTLDVDPVIGSPTLKDLYSKVDHFGFRSFTWEDFKVIPGNYESVQDKIDKYYQYMELIAIKNRLKRKHDARIKKEKKVLINHHIRDKDENLIK